MSTARKHAPAEAAAEALSAIASKLNSMDDRTDKRLTAVEKGLSAVEKGQAVLMENQLQTNRSLAAIMAHLGIPKPTD